MPCDQIRYYDTAFDPKNAEILQKTVERLGWKMRAANVIITDQGEVIQLRDGKAVCRMEDQAAANKLKVEYGQTCLTQAQQWAQQRGWQTQKTGSKLTMTLKGK